MVPAALEGGGEYMRGSDAGPTPPDSISSTLIHWAYLGDVHNADTGGCHSFTHQSLLSAETDPFRLDSQFECSRTYSHQYEQIRCESCGGIIEKTEATCPHCHSGNESRTTV